MSEYVELYPGQYRKIRYSCQTAFNSGKPWLPVSLLQEFCGGWPIAGAVMALREQGKLQTRIGPTGRVEVAVSEVAGG